MRIIKSMTVIAVLLSGAAVYAEQSMTRDEVHAELAAAQAAGELTGVNEPWDGSASTQTRELGIYGRPFAEPTTVSDLGMGMSDEFKQQMRLDYIGGY